VVLVATKALKATTAFLQPLRQLVAVKAALLTATAQTAVRAVAAV
jgi:hypothetical protein